MKELLKYVLAIIGAILVMPTLLILMPELYVIN